MIWSSSELYAWLARLLEIPQPIVEQWVWGGVILSFLFATVHVLTMLVTRWGDHHASSKSLLFSFLIHLSSGAGVLVLAPGPVRDQVGQDQTPIQIQDILLAGVRQSRDDLAGNTPSWETVLQQDTPLARALREQFQPEPAAAPERQQERPELLPTEIPDVATPPVREMERPELTLAEPSPKLAATAAPTLEVPDLPAPQPEMTEGAPESTLMRSPRPQSVAESDSVQRPEAGGVDRVVPEPLPVTTLKSPDAQRGPTPEMPARGELAEVIERRQASEQAAPENLSPGDAPSGGTGPSQASSNENRMITRSPRTSTGSPDVVVERTPSPAMEPGSLTNPELLALSPSGPLTDQLPRMAAPTPLNFDAVRRGETAEIPATYRLRDLARRKEIARSNGGTDASEEAVERSLAWLAKVQEPQGFWDGSKHGSGQIEIDEAGINRQRAGLESDTGLTGLTILAFLGAGYTQEEGKYSAVVTKAINWLIDQQRDDGYLGGNATRYAGMYCHGMATYALAEAYGMRSERAIDDRLAQAVARGVQFTLTMQNKQDGGWRYLPDWSGDMSMFGWQMMAIKSAEIAGISIPETSRNLMFKFLRERSLGQNQGLAAYHPEYGPEITPSMTAEALFCKQMLGLRRDNPASAEATAYLLKAENQPKRSNPNLYYWYYGTLAMFQYGGTEWDQWNTLLRELLVQSQVKRGDLSGSWNPDGPWGGYGGRIYSTTLATLSLEVYYRFLPLYRLGDNVTPE